MALIAVAALFSGRDKIEGVLTDPEFWHSGTVQAVDACMKQPGSNIVSAEAMRNLCAFKHSKTQAFLDATLSSVVGVGAAPTANFTMTIYNNSLDLIVTGADVAVLLKDGKDKGKGTVKNLWVQPGSGQVVPLILDREFPPKDADGNSSLVWYFTIVKAVKIGD